MTRELTPAAQAAIDAARDDITEQLGLGVQEVPGDDGGTIPNTWAAGNLMEAAAEEIRRLTLENWQLKGALGYPVPGHIPNGPFKCGMCEARSQGESQ